MNALGAQYEGANICSTRYTLVSPCGLRSRSAQGTTRTCSGKTKQGKAMLCRSFQAVWLLGGCIFVKLFCFGFFYYKFLSFWGFRNF